jgi:hypothetical protein
MGQKLRDEDGPFEGPIPEGEAGTHSPLEAFSGYRGNDWSPERLAFHQNLEQFADRVGLIVALQSNGKISQDQAFDEIRQIWSQLEGSHGKLLKSHPDD